VGEKRGRKKRQELARTATREKSFTRMRKS